MSQIYAQKPTKLLEILWLSLPTLAPDVARQGLGNGVTVRNAALVAQLENQEKVC